MTFAQGFRIGADIYTNAQAAKLRQAEEARKQAEFEYIQSERQREAQERNAAAGIRRAAMVDYTGVSQPLANEMPTGLRAPSTGLSNDPLATPAAPTGLRAPADFGAVRTTEGIPTVDISGSGQGIRAQSNVAPDLYQQRPTMQVDDDLRPMLTAMRLADARGDDAAFSQTYMGLAQEQRTRNENRGDMEFAMRAADPTSPEAQELRRLINVTTSNLVVNTDPKTGIATFMNTASADPQEIAQLRPDQMMTVARAARMIQRGNPEGISLLASVNKDLAAAVVQDIDMRMNVGKANNDAVKTRADIENQRGNLALRGAELRQRQEERAENSQIARVANLREFFNEATGQVELGEISLRNGRPTVTPVETPRDFRLGVPQEPAGLAPLLATADAIQKQMAEGLIPIEEGQTQLVQLQAQADSIRQRDQFRRELLRQDPEGRVQTLQGLVDGMGERFDPRVLADLGFTPQEIRSVTPAAPAPQNQGLPPPSVTREERAQQQQAERDQRAESIARVTRNFGWYTSADVLAAGVRAGNQSAIAEAQRRQRLNEQQRYMFEVSP